MFKVICLTIFLIGPLQSIAAVKNVDKLVNQELQAVIHEKDAFLRVERARSLSNHVALLKQAEIQSISCETVSDLIGLLATERPSVAAPIARVLGTIGPRARFALPLLRKALDASSPPANTGGIDPEPSWDDSEIFRTAIRSIESEGPSESCGTASPPSS